MDHQLDWQLSGPPPLLQIGSAIAAQVGALAREQLPDIADLFPFARVWNVAGEVHDGWVIVMISDAPSQQQLSMGDLSPEHSARVSALASRTLSLSLQDLIQTFGADWVTPQRFTYLGPHRTGKVSWTHLNESLLQWLNSVVVPDALMKNQRRVLRAIPQTPRFDLSLLEALWILECEETFLQGTAFTTQEGTFTCDHVIGTATQAFRATRAGVKYPVRVVARNADVDLAIIEIVSAPQGRHLKLRSAADMKMMDHVVVAGFPNYRIGDSGVIVPGLVVGFRGVRGVQRLLTNASIVAGTSGGPVFAADNSVIGIAGDGFGPNGNGARY